MARTSLAVDGGARSPRRALYPGRVKVWASPRGRGGYHGLERPRLPGDGVRRRLQSVGAGECDGEA